MKKPARYLDGPGPDIERQAKLFVLLYSAEEVKARKGGFTSHSGKSPQVREGNFRLIGTDDLERLFNWYDREFFAGRLGEMLMEDEAHPVTFRLSRRLVSAAGQTIREVSRSTARHTVREGRIRNHDLGHASLQHLSGGGSAGDGRRPALSRPGRGAQVFSSTNCCTWRSFSPGDAQTVVPPISIRFPGASLPTRALFTT